MKCVKSMVIIQNIKRIQKFLEICIESLHLLLHFAGNLHKNLEKSEKRAYGKSLIFYKRLQDNQTTSL